MKGASMLFLPVRPEYASMIVSGHKTIELRKRCPRRIGQGDRVVFYATSPRFQLVAVADVRRIISEETSRLWRIVKSEAGIDRNIFNAYFDGCQSGYGIEIENVQGFSPPIALKQLREKWGGFSPPQGFGYLTESQSQHVQIWLQDSKQQLDGVMRASSVV